MRDAFGGTFMLKLGIVFIVFYIAFMAVAINYAKAFRVKNQVINIVEQYQFTGKSDQSTIDIIDTYLASVPYNFGESSDNPLISECKKIAGDNGDYIYTTKGACIIKQPGSTDKARYYKVVTFIHIDFSFFDIHMTFPISGETKTIYN